MPPTKPFPWKCLHCRERSVAPTELSEYTREFDHDGRKYTVTLKDLAVLQCAHCGEIVLDEAANLRISDGLRRAAGLLLPADIRSKREALGLTQRQMAAALQIAESTLSRWETGAQIQQRCMDRFLRSFFDLEELRSLSGERKRGGNA